MPDLTDQADAFGMEWAAWWHSLQVDQEGQPLPEGQYHNPVLPNELTAEQGELMKGGPNGVFLLLISLAWWGAAVSDQDMEKVSHFRRALRSFARIISALAFKAQKDKEVTEE